LPFGRGGTKRAPERFLAKAGIQPGTNVFIVFDKVSLASGILIK